MNDGVPAAIRAARARIVTLKLYCKRFNWLPRSIAYALNMFELTLKLFFRGLLIRPVVVHCHDTMVLPAGVMIKLATNCKLVYDAHELESNKKGQTRILSKGTLFIERLSWRWVDLLISVSDSILFWYEENLGTKEHELVLNSPEIEDTTVMDSRISPVKKYFHEIYNISDNTLVFLYLGILSMGRGIDVVLEAFASSSIGAHVVFVGYGELSKHIQIYSDKHPNIHLHKPVPYNQVVTLARSADIGICLIEDVSLSDYYCLPNKLFEYCFAGLHLLTSDFPEIKKVVEQYSLGTCCAPYPDKVQETIRLLIDNPPVKNSADLSSLSWSRQVERLVRGYRKLLVDPAQVCQTLR